jgi:dolichol-phosphate mannosyltransferase
MRALVTGAGGFVGANLVRHLLELDHEPVALVRPDGDPWRLAQVSAQVRTEPLDLGDLGGLTDLVRRIRPDVIFHLAAYGAYSWQTDLDTMLNVNVRATRAILQVALEIDARVVYAGSSSEYGRKAEPSRESDRLEPNSDYAITKAAATHLCRLAADSYGLAAVTLRLYSIYGPWEEPGRLMPTLVARALRGEYPQLASPDTARDYVWIDDACEAFVEAAVARELPAVTNVASGKQTTLRELTEIVADQFQISETPVWGGMPDRAWDTACWIGDPSVAQSTLGWRARTTVSEGLRRLAGWIQEDPGRRTLYAPGHPIHDHRPLSTVAVATVAHS